MALGKYRYKPTGQYVDVVRIVEFGDPWPRQFAYCADDKGIRQPIALHLLERVVMQRNQQAYETSRALRCMKARKTSGLLRMEKQAMKAIERINYAPDTDWPARPYTPATMIPMKALAVLGKPSSSYEFVFKDGMTVKDIIAAADAILVHNHRARMSLQELDRALNATKPHAI